MMSHDNCVISVQHVSKKYGNKQVLHDISLNVNKAEIFGILGPPGSGKTTLVKMLIGMEQRNSDDVYVLGTLMPKLSMLQQIGYMAQSDALYT